MVPRRRCAAELVLMRVGMQEKEQVKFVRDAVALRMLAAAGSNLFQIEFKLQAIADKGFTLTCSRAQRLIRIIPQSAARLVQGQSRRTRY